jgi:Zn-dependent alcohol dehydrogenase
VAAATGRTEGKTKRAVVYGYGGVTNVVVHVLKKLGYTVALTGRRLDEAERRAKELGATVFRRGDKSTFQLLVNAAPVTDRPLDQAVGLLDALAMVSNAGDGCAFDHEMPGAYLKAYCEENNIHHVSTQASIRGAIKRRNGLDRSSAGMCVCKIAL